jgi:ubiquinol-cytochrome c reductase subunit 6
MSDIRGTIKSMIEKGQDPKDYLIEVCRPQCISLQQKLQRCETALKNMTNADPELSCMYPLRDWVTCVDGCVYFHLPRSNLKSMPNLSEMNSDSSHDS